MNVIRTLKKTIVTQVQTKANKNVSQYFLMLVSSNKGIYIGFIWMIYCLIDVEVKITFKNTFI